MAVYAPDRVVLCRHGCIIAGPTAGSMIEARVNLAVSCNCGAKPQPVRSVAERRADSLDARREMLAMARRFDRPVRRCVAPRAGSVRWMASHLIGRKRP